MKRTVFALFAVFALVAHAAENKPSSAGADKDAKRIAARQRMLEKTGGIIEKAGTGRVVVVNAQDKIPARTIAERINMLNKAVRVRIDIEKGSWKFGDKVPEGANAAIFVVNNPDLPISLLAIEEQWGVLNVAKLDKGRRFNRAFVRVAISTLGAGVSQFKGSPMQPVTCVEDLDKLDGDGITIDALRSILSNLQRIGVTQPTKTTYRKACMEGWAPSPTNDYQKAIWDETR